MIARNVCASLLALALAVGGVSCGSDTDAETVENSESAEVSDMSAVPDDLDAQLAKAISLEPSDEAVVLDVRTDEEWNTQHAVGAVHWGLVEHLEQGQFPDLDKDTEIFLYCRSGNRSGQAIKLMQAEGFTNLTNIGGMQDWVGAGGAVVEGVDGDAQ